ncbi:MAG: hypothetical protein JXR81_01865 [Candidatus Goldbacteria bacterium]|nr:hypothetical protein [Candidatus Goldiibacteriota bacterium]
MELIRELAKSQDFTIADRLKNTETFDRLNFIPPFINDISEVISALKVEEYSKGPENDDGGYEGEIYTFRKIVQGINVYIKIRFLEDDGMTYMTVISFHN